MNINSKIIKKHFLGEDKYVRIIKDGRSLYGQILEVDGEYIVFKTLTQTSLIHVGDIGEILLVKDGGN